MTEVRPQPWYRQFWPWFLFALPLAVVVAGALTAWIAFKDADGVVVDDYYKEGLAINQTLDRDRKAGELAMKATLGFSENAVFVELSGKELPAALKLHLEHPTRAAKDLEFMLTRDASGVYRQAIEAPLTGTWYVTLTPVPDGWRLTGPWSAQPGKTVVVTAKPTT